MMMSQDTDCLGGQETRGFISSCEIYCREESKDPADALLSLMRICEELELQKCDMTDTNPEDWFLRSIIHHRVKPEKHRHYSL